MRTIDISNFRRQSYGLAMKHVLDECSRFGVANLWDTDLRRVPSVRAGALAGRTETLACHLEQARHHASLAGFGDAAELLATRQSELRQLAVDVARLTIPVDVTVLDGDWGCKGRGARIIAAIRADGLTAGDVAERFQLAMSTAKAYMRRARAA